jgi:hypothetical protein
VRSKSQFDSDGALDSGLCLSLRQIEVPEKKEKEKEMDRAKLFKFMVMGGLARQ